MSELQHGEGLREAESVQLSSAARMTMETLHELIQKKEEALEKLRSRYLSTSPPDYF